MTGVLDDFNRANAAGLGANWTEGDWLGDHFQIVANQCAHQGAQNQFGDAYWTAANYGPAVEVFLTVVEWQMGWPTGWTDPAAPVTGFVHWLRRSRTELSRLLSGPGLRADKPGQG